MRLDVRYQDGVVEIYAEDDHMGPVSTGKGATLREAVVQLVRRFAEMQQDTIDALNKSGIVVYNVPEEGPLS